MNIATLTIEMAANVARLQQDLQAARGSVDSTFASIGSSVAKLKALVGTVFAGIAVGELLGAVEKVKTAAVDIERIAAASGASLDEFQRAAAGAKTVGVNLEKFGDIMKDTQDKLGDFLITGGGELKDFFETIGPKVGVTAESFRNLSGPQALQLFYTSLEKAGVGQKVMIQQMESIADDASMLAPLLANGGAEFKSLGEEAAKAGALMSGELIYASKALGEEMTRMDTVVGGITNSIMAELIPAITEMAAASREELSAGFEAVSAWVQDNKEHLLGAWELTKSIGAEVWSIVKVAIELAVGIGKWAVESGFLEASLVTIGLLVAGFKDGVDIVGAAFAKLGSIILNAVAKPMSGFLNDVGVVLKWAGQGDLAGVFLDAAEGIKTAGEAGAAYADGVASKFAAGDTAVARFTAGLGASTQAAQAAAKSTYTAYQALGTGAGISAKATEEAKKSADKAAAAAQKLAEEGVKLAASLLAQDSGLSGDFTAKWGKLNAAYKAGAVSLADLTQAQKLLLAEQPAMKAAADAQKKALEEQAQAWADVRSAMLAYRHAQEQAAQSVADGNQSLRDEIELIGLSSRQQTEVLKKRTQAIVLIKQATLAEMERQSAITGTMTREQIALAAEIEGLQERNELLGAQEARESWTGFWESVNSTAHDTFVDVANNGMSAFKRIGQTLKSAVLDMLYQMTIKKWIVSIGASVGGMGGMAQAASATASTLGAAGDAASVYSAGSALAGLGAFGGAVSGFGTAALSAAQTMVGMTGTVAQMTTSLAAAGHTAASGLAAGVNAFAAIPGWGWALAGVALLAGSGLGKTRGANHGGGIYSSAGLSDQDAAQSIAGNLGWADPVTDFTARGNAALSGQVRTAVGSLLEMYAGLGALAKGTVADLEVVAGFAANSKHKDEDVYGYFKIFDKLTGDLLNEYSNREMGKDADAAWAQYVADLGSAMVSQLLEADIPSWMATVLNELGEAPTMDALTGAVAKIHTIDAAFGAFSATIDGFAGLTDKAREALMQAFGGIEGLSTSMTAYYEAYYSEAERAAKSTEALRLEFAKAGKELPATKEAYRAMVESALDGGEATAGFAAALIRLAPAFDSAKSAMTSLQAETKSLQIELMRASGDIAGAAAAQRALDTSGFDSATLAAYDLNESLREQVKAAEDAKAAREKAAAEEQNLQRTLKTLLGDTVWLREQELSTLNASNRGLQERIWALEDAKAAEAAARNNVEAAFSMLEKSVAAEKKAISDRLAAQEAGHQAQIDAAQEASSAIQSIASALANAVKSVRIETDRFDWRRLLAARSTISSATTAADLSQVVGLEDALGVAGQDNKKFYGRFEDYAFDQGVMAGNINLLDEKARLQLSTSDQMLLTLKDQLNAAKEAANAEMAALDAQLEEQRHLANVALGIDDSVLSVADAIAALGTAINGLAAAQAQVAIAQAQASAAAASMSGSGGGGTSYEGATYTDFMGNQVALQAGQSSQFLSAVAAAGTSAVSSLSELRDRLQAVGKSDIWEALSKDLTLNYQDFDQTGGKGVPTISASDGGVVLTYGYKSDTQTNAQYGTAVSGWAETNGVQNLVGGGVTQTQVSDAIKTVLGQGASIADIINSGAVNYGLSEQQVREAARSAGIPGFSQGINVVPHDMLAQIHEGEAVVPAHFNPFNPHAANSNSDELVAELRALRVEVAELKASNNAIAGHTAATHRQLVRIAPNDRVQTEVAA